MTPTIGRVAILGEEHRVQGFALAGALVLVANDRVAARSQWAALPPDVAVVILSPFAVAALGDLWPDASRLTVVMPA